MRTLLSFKSTSVIASLLESDIFNADQGGAIKKNQRSETRRVRLFDRKVKRSFFGGELISFGGGGCDVSLSKSRPPMCVGVRKIGNRYIDLWMRLKWFSELSGRYLWRIMPGYHIYHARMRIRSCPGKGTGILPKVLLRQHQRPKSEHQTHVAFKGALIVLSILPSRDVIWKRQSACAKNAVMPWISSILLNVRH